MQHKLNWQKLPELISNAGTTKAHMTNRLYNAHQDNIRLLDNHVNGFQNAVVCRAGHTANLVGKTIFVFGGRNGDHFFNDVWAFDIDTESWKELQEHAPFPARAYHSATLVRGNEIWIVGGSDAKTMYNDVHILKTDKLEWSSPVLRGQGVSRGTHAAVLHPLKPNAILIFGGYGGYADAPLKWLEDLLVLYTDSLEWEVLRPEGVLPCARGYHSLTTFEHKVLLFGGKNGAGIIKEKFISVYDAINNRWFTPKTVGKGPKSRSNHAAAMPQNHHIVIHGGRRGSSRLKDFFVLQVSSNETLFKWHKYEAQESSGSKSSEKQLNMVNGTDGPEGRAAHTLIVRENSLYLFAGYGGEKCTFSDMYVIHNFPYPGCPAQAKAHKVVFAPLRMDGTDEHEGWLSTKRSRKSHIFHDAEKEVPDNFGTSDPYRWVPDETPEKILKYVGETSIKNCSLKRKSTSGFENDLGKEAEVLRRQKSSLEREVADERFTKLEILKELESVRDERAHLRRRVDTLQEQVEAGNNNANTLQRQIDSFRDSAQKADSLLNQVRDLKEELQAIGLAVELKEKEKQEFRHQLRNAERKLEERESSLEHIKGLYEDAVLERDEYKSCVQKLEVELQKQMETLKQTKANYESERNFLLQEIAERKGTADRIFMELGVSKESCRVMQDTLQQLSRQLEQANEKLERYQREKEELHRSNGALAAELRQMVVAKDGAESSLQLVKTELESARTLIERNGTAVTKLKQNADEAACHITTLHASLKKAQEELKLKIEDNERLRSHVRDVEEFEQAQMRLLQGHIEKLQCARQSCPGAS